MDIIADATTHSGAATKALEERAVDMSVVRQSPDALRAWGYVDQQGNTRDPWADEPASLVDLYWSEEHRRTRLAIVQGITRSDFVAISAPVGWGKTFLLLAIGQELEEQTQQDYIIARVASMDRERIGPNTIQRALIDAMGEKLPVNVDSERISAAVERYLRARHERRRHVVLLIDEAHRLSAAALRTLKALSDLRVGFHRLLSVVLLGQEELATVLARYDLREVGARIQVWRPLPLDPAQGEVAAYIRHRCAIAQYGRPPLKEDEEVSVPFDVSAIDAIADELSGSGELPMLATVLAVNSLAAHAMHYTWELMSGSGELPTVTESEVRAARARMREGV